MSTIVLSVPGLTKFRFSQTKSGNLDILGTIPGSGIRTPGGLYCYSTNGGTTWIPLSGQRQATTIEIDLTLLPGSPMGKFRVWASDGVTRPPTKRRARLSSRTKPPQILAGDLLSGLAIQLQAACNFRYGPTGVSSWLVITRHH